MIVGVDKKLVKSNSLVIPLITLFLLVAAIYSVSTHYVSAVKTSRQCGESRPIGEGYVAKDCCDITEDDDGKILSVKCFTMVCNDKGCGVAERSAPKINPEDLNELIENNTKSPNTDLLKNNGVLEPNNDDGKEPKAPKVPDEFGGLNDNGG